MAQEADCSCDAEMEEIGFLPEAFIQDSAPSDTWVRALMCQSCGGLRAKSISDEEFNNSRRGLAKSMVKHEIMSKEEIVAEEIATPREAEAIADAVDSSDNGD